MRGASWDEEQTINKRTSFRTRQDRGRFVLLSKPFNQHSGSIYLRSKFYLIVMISFDVATTNYNQVWLLSAMTACVLPLRLPAIDLTCTWTGSGHTWQLTGPAGPDCCCWNRIDWHCEFCHHSSRSIHCSYSGTLSNPTTNHYML